MRLASRRGRTAKATITEKEVEQQGPQEEIARESANTEPELTITGESTRPIEETRQNTDSRSGEDKGKEKDDNAQDDTPAAAPRTPTVRRERTYTEDDVQELLDATRQELQSRYEVREQEILRQKENRMALFEELGEDSSTGSSPLQDKGRLVQQTVPAPMRLVESATRGIERGRPSKIKISKFSGEKELVSTLKLQTRLRRLAGDDDATIRTDLMAAMRGSAATWLSQQLEANGIDISLDALLKRIESHYNPLISVGEAASNFQRMVQEPSETVYAYGLRLTAEATRAGIKHTDLMIRQALVNGLQHADTRKKAMRWLAPNSAEISWEDLIDRLHKEDSIAKANINADTNRGVPPKEGGNTAGKSGINLMRNQGGDGSRNRPKKEIPGKQGNDNSSAPQKEWRSEWGPRLCHLCKKPGHLISQCWDNPKNWVDGVHPRRGSQYGRGQDRGGTNPSGQGKRPRSPRRGQGRGQPQAPNNDNRGQYDSKKRREQEYPPRNDDRGEMNNINEGKNDDNGDDLKE